LAIKNELNLPVKFVGLGEKIDDLQPFDAEQFVYGLFGDVFEEKENVDTEESAE
ncbi:MAG: signal recognition particle-docking protein FtsY, partial [Exiguobacterium acetylicum]